MGTGGDPSGQPLCRHPLQLALGPPPPATHLGALPLHARPDQSFMFAERFGQRQRPAVQLARGSASRELLWPTGIPGTYVCCYTLAGLKGEYACMDGSDSTPQRAGIALDRGVRRRHAEAGRRGRRDRR